MRQETWNGAEAQPQEVHFQSIAILISACAHEYFWPRAISHPSVKLRQRISSACSRTDIVDVSSCKPQHEHIKPQIIVLSSDILLRDWHRFTMGWQHLSEHDLKPQGRCAEQPLSPFDVMKLGFVPALKLGKCSEDFYWSPPLCFMNLLAAASFSSLSLSLSHTHTHTWRVSR